jgi:hypothetical protein
MRKIKLLRITVPLLAALLPTYAIFIVVHALRRSSPAHILDKLPAPQTVLLEWANIAANIWRIMPVYAVAIWFLTGLACIWWLARPSRLPACALFGGSFLCGPSFTFIMLFFSCPSGCN